MSLSEKKESGASAVSEQQILEALSPIQDPDLHRSIVDLGFIKNIRIDGADVAFDLELTTPACPVKDQLRDACVEAAESIDGVGHAEVNLTARTRGGLFEQRQILKNVKNIIAVASGKGGVGKSTTAANLAFALQKSGALVGVLDADIYGPSMPTMIRIDAQPKGLGGGSLEPAIGSGGIKVMSMGFFVKRGQAAILRGPMVSGYVSQFLNRVEWGELDYLLIDYPPGTGDVQLTLSQQAPITGAVIVTTPQEISLADVERAIGMFETTKVPVLGVCEAMSYFICDQCEKKHLIFRGGGGARIAKRIGVPFLGEIPIDPRVAQSGDEGQPIVESHPDSPVAEIYTEIAGAVAAQLSILHHERGQYLESFKVDWNPNL